MRNAGLYGGWSAWRAFVDRQRTMGGALRKAMLLLAGRCARRMKNAGLYGGWSAWRAFLERQRTMGGALRRMMARKLSMAFEKWQATAAAMARESYMMGGALR